ncbi:Cna B-type domain-containing protein, partial [Bifidobacterium mongoliense]|uniref:Cna B-type domain-containing protein n=1 Tax=Bifidobacterium mongoliense TaxID=518643 RepID=UPI0030EE0B6A
MNLANGRAAGEKARTGLIYLFAAIMTVAATLLSFVLSPSARADDVSSDLCTTQTAVSLDKYVTGLTVSKNGSATNPDSTFAVGDSGKILLTYKIGRTDLSLQQCKFTYQIPNKYIGTPEQSGGIIGSDGNSVGKYTIEADGLLTLVFSKAFASGSGTANGNILADFTITSNNTGENQNIILPGGDGTTTIIVTPTASDKGIDVSKTGAWNRKWDTKDNTTLVSYTTTVSAHKDGSPDSISINDAIQTAPKGIKSLAYQQDSFTVTGPDGSLINPSQYTLAVDNTSQPPSFSITGLPALQGGQKYVVHYDVAARASDLNAASSIVNTVGATSGDSKPTANANVQVSRTVVKKYSTVNGDSIKWTIELNGDKAVDLSEFTLTSDVLKQTLGSETTDVSADFIPDEFVLTDTTDSSVAPITIKKDDLFGKRLGSIIPAGHATDTWQITYTQAGVNKPGIGQTVSYNNTVTVNDQHGHALSGVGRATPGGGSDTFSVNKKFEQGTDSSPTAKNSTLTWSSNVILPLSGLPGNATFTDSLAACTGGNGNVPCNQFNTGTDSSLNTITLSGSKNNGNPTILHRGSDYTVAYQKAGKPVDVAAAGWSADTFVITFTKAIAYNAETAASAHLVYTSFADFTAMTAGSSYSICNTAAAKAGDVQKSSSQCTQHYVSNTTPNIEKRSAASDGSFWSGWNTVTYQSDSAKQQLQYRIRFNTNSNDVTSGDHTIVDTLPQGTTYVDGSMTALFNDKDTTAGSIKASDLVEFKGYDKANNTVTFLVHDGYGSNEIGITYAVSYAGDSAWKDFDPYQSQTEKYTNSASIDGKPPVNATTTVQRDADKRVVKTGHQNTANPNAVSYSVVVNPEAKTLLKDSTDGKITVTDVMANSANTSTNTIVDGSLSVYTYDPTAEDHIGTPVASSEYTSSYDQSSRTLKVKLDDGKAYVITYTYFVTASAAGTIAKQFNMSNAVTIEGVDGSSSQNSVQYASSSGTATRAVLTFNKIDDSKNPVGAGATFLLEKFDGTKWSADGTVQPMNTQNGELKNVGGKITTDAASLIQFDLGATDTFTPGTLYRIKEVQAPQGYQVNADTRYFSIDSVPNALPTSVTVNDINVIKSTDGYEFDVVDNAITSVSVSKHWDDAGNQDGVRPSSVKVQLFADGVAQGDPVQLDAAGNWSHTFSGLALRAHGKDVAYTVKELDVPTGYTSSVQETSPGNWIVTNTHKPAVTSVSGVKHWDDADDQDGERPSSVKVNLLADGAPVGSATVDAASDWKYSFSDLPVFKSGVKIAYTVTEDQVANYVSSVSGFDVTNTHTPGKTSVSVSKHWDDAGNQDGVRPSSVKVQLFADGVAQGDPVQLDA